MIPPIRVVPTKMRFTIKKRPLGFSVTMEFESTKIPDMRFVMAGMVDVAKGIARQVEERFNGGH